MHAARAVAAEDAMSAVEGSGVCCGRGDRRCRIIGDASSAASLGASFQRLSTSFLSASLHHLAIILPARPFHTFHTNRVKCIGHQLSDDKLRIIRLVLHPDHAHQHLSQPCMRVQKMLHPKTLNPLPFPSRACEYELSCPT
eukprot:366338-Chlamydomonas_euryale.AAC.4